MSLQLLDLNDIRNSLVEEFSALTECFALPPKDGLTFSTVAVHRLSGVIDRLDAADRQAASLCREIISDIGASK